MWLTDHATPHDEHYVSWRATDNLCQRQCLNLSLTHVVHKCQRSYPLEMQNLYTVHLICCLLGCILCRLLNGQATFRQYWLVASWASRSYAVCSRCGLHISQLLHRRIGLYTYVTCCIMFVTDQSCVCRLVSTSAVAYVIALSGVCVYDTRGLWGSIVSLFQHRFHSILGLLQSMTGWTTQIDVEWLWSCGVQLPVFMT